MIVRSFLERVRWETPWAVPTLTTTGTVTQQMNSQLNPHNGLTLMKTVTGTTSTGLKATVVLKPLGPQLLTATVALTVTVTVGQTSTMHSLP